MTNLEKLQLLWGDFEYALEIKGLNLSSFAKKWQAAHDNIEDDYQRVYDRLKKIKTRKDGNSKIQEKTIKQVEAYTKFLRKNYAVQELLEDETVDHWFDD